MKTDTFIADILSFISGVSGALSLHHPNLSIFLSKPPNAPFLSSEISETQGSAVYLSSLVSSGFVLACDCP
jgi:hypothetical protein